MSASDWACQSGGRAECWDMRGRHSAIDRAYRRMSRDSFSGWWTWRRSCRYGYRRVTGLLGGEGWRVNHKRVARLWRREGLVETLFIEPGSPWENGLPGVVQWQASGRSAVKPRSRRYFMSVASDRINHFLKKDYLRGLVRTNRGLSVTDLPFSGADP